MSRFLTALSLIFLMWVLTACHVSADAHALNSEIAAKLTPLALSECPDLVGEYENANSEDVTQVTRDERGVQIFQLDRYNILIADGRPQKSPNGRTTTTATCHQNQIRLESIQGNATYKADLRPTKEGFEIAPSSTMLKPAIYIRVPSEPATEPPAPTPSEPTASSPTEEPGTL